MSYFGILVCSCALLNFQSAKPAAEKPDLRPSCVRKLKAIGRALSRFHEERGKLPDQLSDLVPKYIADAGLLHCPADEGNGSTRFGGVANGDNKSSYLYEMSSDLDSSGSFQL